MGSPNPNLYASPIDSIPALPSHLLRHNRTGISRLRINCAKCSSMGVTPARPSIINTATSHASMACSVWRRMRPWIESSKCSSKPAVSIIVTLCPINVASASRQSRVTPGVSLTMANFFCAMRLNMVDFPTFGRPINAMRGGGVLLMRCVVSWYWDKNQRIPIVV